MPKCTRPRRVVIAVYLYLASLALGIISSVLIPVAGPLWFSALILLIMLLLAFALWHRQGWSRFVFLAMFLLGLPIMFAIHEMLAERGVLGVAILVIQTLLQATSLALLFTGESAVWYKRKSVATEEARIGP